MRDGPGIVLLADPRYPGGTTRSLLGEAAALRRAGAWVGFGPVLGSELGRGAAVRSELLPYLACGTLRPTDLRERQRTRLLVVHHPALFRHLPAEPLGLAPERTVLVLHHPPLDGLGRPAYELALVAANLRDAFGAEVALAPVGPVVRRQLGRLDLRGHPVLEEDWGNLFDFDAWPLRPGRPSGPGLVLGRHSRPALEKFPDTLAEALEAYPDAAGLRVRMLGAPPDLAARYGGLPANWELLPEDALPVGDFLGSLDYWVYRHGRAWVEAFGYAALEAIATGVPALLPPEFEETFGPTALYAEPGGLGELIAGLEARPGAYEAHVARARQEAEARFSSDLYLPRLDRLAPGWRDPARASAAARPLAPLRTVMVTSNGVGLGHLTRLMAIARAWPEESRTAFFTLSRGFRLAEEAGFLTQYVPSHQMTGAPIEAWNLALAEELGDFLDLVGPDLVVFDGNLPYAGLVSALDQRRGLRRAWVRRAMWNAELPEASRRAGTFDLVLEPGELAQSVDVVGLGTRAKAVRTAPILATPRREALPRGEAREGLGLPPEALVVGVMLGSAENFDLSEIRRAILGHLRTRPDVTVIEIGASPRPPADEGPRRVELYPAARLFAGFDLLVATAGYNSFHEALIHGLPAVFVPNEAPEMDLQLLRARWARSAGMAELLRATDAIRAPAVLDRLLDPEERARMRARMARLEEGDGAAEAAGHLLRLGRMLRLRQPL